MIRSILTKVCAREGCTYCLFLLFDLLFDLLFSSPSSAYLPYSSYPPLNHTDSSTPPTHTSPNKAEMPHATKPKPKPKTKTKGRGKGPLDPPGQIANTYSQLLAKPHISTPILPLIGCERQFQRRPMLKDGEGDEALEVGVLRYKQGPGIGKSFLFFFCFFWSLLYTIIIKRGLVVVEG